MRRILVIWPKALSTSYKCSMNDKNGRDVETRWCRDVRVCVENVHHSMMRWTSQTQQKTSRKRSETTFAKSQPRVCFAPIEVIFGPSCSWRNCASDRVMAGNPRPIVPSLLAVVTLSKFTEDIKQPMIAILFVVKLTMVAASSGFLFWRVVEYTIGFSMKFYIG